jgi:molybdenum cofactor cytidylyltransferase
MNVSAIIMAAGLSKRMNQNKLMMKINEKYIYEFIFETINMCSDSFSEIIVVAKETEILEKACEFGFFAVKNEISHLGQSASVRLGVENSNKPDGYMFFVADQPFIKDDTIKMLLSVFKKNPNSIIIASYNGMNGNPVIFPKLFKTQLLNLVGDIGGKIIIKNNPDKLIRVHIDTEDEFIDIDTLKDYERILKKVID